MAAGKPGPTAATNTRWLLAGLACLALWPAPGLAQDVSWESTIAAGQEAYQRADYAEADNQFMAALKQAEGFGPQDPRLATSLNGLAALYRSLGRYTEAEPLHKRALAIREKALGPDHPDVARSFNNLAVLYVGEGRYAAAEPCTNAPWRSGERRWARSTLAWPRASKTWGGYMPTWAATPTP